MNKLMFSISAAVVGSLLAGTASEDFTSISWDVTNIGANGTTYQIYVDLDAGDQLNAVYGDDVIALSISAVNGVFYQNAFGTHSVAGMNPALFGVFPSLMYDSFVTIGLEDNVGNAMLDIGIDWTDFNAGGEIWTDNGSWFATPDDAQVYAVDGRVLIGQFTVADDDGIHGTINMQGKNADGSNWTATDVYFNTIPAPGALALLGLAGLASRRRRS